MRAAIGAAVILTGVVLTFVAVVVLFLVALRSALD